MKSSIELRFGASQYAGLAVTVDLHVLSAANNCNGIHGMLDRAVEKGDERTLFLMRQLGATHEQIDRERERVREEFSGGTG